VDLLEAADARTVKANPLLEKRLIQRTDGDAEVLPGARHVCKLEIHHADALLTGHPHHLRWCRRHATLLPSNCAPDASSLRLQAHCTTHHLHCIVVTSTVRWIGAKCQKWQRHVVHYA